jgi:hypothetical protein
MANDPAMMGVRMTNDEWRNLGRRARRSFTMNKPRLKWILAAICPARWDSIFNESRSNYSSQGNQ